MLRRERKRWPTPPPTHPHKRSPTAPPPQPYPPIPPTHLQHGDEVGLPILRGWLREEGAALDRGEQRAAVAKLRD